MTRRVAYLSGSIAGLTYEAATEQRAKATELFRACGWDVLDPMRGKEILSSLKTIDESRSLELLGGLTPQAIVQRDFDDLRRADVMLVLSGEMASWGTAFEWAVAHFMLHKPIVVVVPQGAKTRDHPWCKSMAAKFAETVEEAVDFINTWFDRGYGLDG